MPKGRIKLLHLSDTHFGSSHSYTFRGYSPVSNFRAVCSYILNYDFDFDLIVHTGDVGGDKKQAAVNESYQIASAEINELIAKTKKPFCQMPGNHDSDAVELKLVPGSGLNALQCFRNDYRFDLNGYRFIALASAMHQERQGTLTTAQLENLSLWLENSSTPVVILLHHPPCGVGVGWMDRTMLLENWTDFQRCIAKHTRLVRAVLFGHIHFPFRKTINGVTYAAAPSTIFQFACDREAPDSSIDEQTSPGFNMIEITETKVSVTPHLVKTE